MTSSRIARYLFLLLIATTLYDAHAGDWPQILGPNRNGIAEQESLLDKWPDAGPQRLWQVKLGEGYGGPVASGQRVVVFHRIGENEQVDCLEAATGKAIWSASFGATYRGGINPDTGPRATPVIAGERVLVYGAAGDLHCLELASGKKLWSRALFVDYEAPEGYFGAGSSPIVIDDRVLVNVGSRDGAAIVALSMATGKTLWTAFDDTASYSSPTRLRFGETEAALFVTRLNCVAVNPADGKVLFDFPFGARGPTVNAATPLVIDRNKLFLTASYGIGARLLSIADQKIATQWNNDTTLSSQYTTPVHRAGVLYGTHGREDAGRASLRAVSLASGKVLWEETDFGVAHVIGAGDKLIVVQNEGKLVLVEATPDAYRPISSTQLTDDTIRAVPALAQGRLLIRSNGQGGGALTCVKVGQE